MHTFLNLVDAVGFIAWALLMLALGIAWLLERRKERKRKECELLGVGGRGMRR